MPTFPLLTHPSLDHVVARHNGLAISVAEFLADVAHLAAHLPAGGHLLNICSNRYHFTVGLAAAIVSGKVSLLPPTNAPEMVRQLKAFAPDAFCLHDDEDCEIDMPRLRYPAAPEHATPKNMTSVSIPQIDSGQRVAVLFTSGSTGTPLPHPKTWGGLVRNAHAQAERLKILDGQVRTIIGTVPPQHMYGLESTVLLPLQTGNALTSTRPFYPADICSAIEAAPMPRILISSPVHLRLLLDAGLELPEVEMVLSATAPLSPQLAETIETQFDAPLLEIYGSTETGQVATRHTLRTAEWQLLPEVKLTQKGERMWASGGHVETPAALNDIIEITDDRHFLLHGRMTDLINIAGKRNSLASLNHQLNAIPGVVDGVFFMPEENSHGHVTRLSACVVAPTLDAKILMAALRERMDPVFLPRPLLFVETLPRNNTGKLPHAALKTLVANIHTAETEFETATSPDPA